MTFHLQSLIILYHRPHSSLLAGQLSALIGSRRLLPVPPYHAEEIQEEDNKGTRKRSASAALQSTDVNLPPICLADFVIHYRTASFYILLRSALRGLPFHCLCCVDLAAQPPPTVNLDAPLPGSEELSCMSPAPIDRCEPVISLCHYLDCTVALSRVELNCVDIVNNHYDDGENDDKDDGEDVSYKIEWAFYWRCFLLAVAYNMQKLKTTCMHDLARLCCQYTQLREEWKKAQPLLDKDTVLHMLQITFKHSSRS